jgi:phage terminase large subunit
LLQRAHQGRLVLLESRHEDNPTVTPAYLARLDALSGVRYQRLRLGKWVAAEGQVWEEWDRARHLVDAFEIPDSWPRLLTVDFGYTHPFVCQWWARDPDGRLYRYREIHFRQRLVEDHAATIASFLTQERWPSQIICDHDAEGRATLEKHLALHTGRRVETTPAIKAVTAGIQAVDARFRPAGDGKPRLFLLRNALVQRDPQADERKLPAATEEEIESYTWDTGNGRRKGEEPVKLHDDGCDALRYAVAACDLTPQSRVQHATFGERATRPTTLTPGGRL